MSSDWFISDANYASQHEIEGYASATSINRGESINLYVNTVDPSYTITIYRMGWYGGAGGRRVAGPITRSGSRQPACALDASVRLVECNWTNPYVLSVPHNTADPTDWASGIYLAKLTGSSGKQSYIIFTVRDDNRSTALLFQQSVTTYAAYNYYGGYSIYGEGSIGGVAAYKVSFNRPYLNLQRPSSGKGAGDFFSWEAKALRFLEREGYDLAYATNIDTETLPMSLRQHKAFLSVGHDEYWTRGMRDSIESARNAGVHLAFLGANNGYWQVRLEPGQFDGRPRRNMVAYKFSAPSLDPQYNSNPAEATYLFRGAPVNRPEASLIGVMYDYNSVDLDMVISDCTSLAWICRQTGLQAGSVLKGLLGYEVDRVDASSPAGITVIAASPYMVGTERRYANMTYYTHGSGAGVFATGSMQWNWGLDDFGERADRVNPAVQQMTRNVLNRFVN
ncbi:hypothetical protein SAMN06265795_11088 [Noviherbaspirillum humi]|uniref:N,N-dimethylformamidase beta subunit-like C-terminal domain-containing protein n=1 Tax=Noviherbaspirillum humi TaxID=1688639 RepID=A0A239IST4_9BURK|nr:N,N-dimethylformamidase beta subunit family domain-containing protein [Noviherbaspirillum humi]SNS96268.1 hypothetical protein SAMN06265795_11088 [Noviherbaspirillum humi]